MRIRRVQPAVSTAAGLALQVEDIELVARMRSGERWAKEAFYRKHVERAYRLARRLVRNDADADDVVQEAFAQAFVDLGKLRDPGALRPWFLRIVVNRAHRKFRRRRVLSFLGLTPPPDSGAVFVHHEAPPDVRAELALLAQTLDQMAVAQRTAWVLRRVEGLSLQEVAQACDVSLATAKRRIASADGAVRQFLALGAEAGSEEGKS